MKYGLVLVAFGISACSSAPVPDALGSTTSNSTTGTTARVSGTEGENLMVRSTPDRSGRVLAELAPDTEVAIDCQIEGESIFGNTVWNHLPQYDGYASDYFLYTGKNGFIKGMPRCEGDEAAPAPSTPPKTSGGGGKVAVAIAAARDHLGYAEGANDCNQFSSWLNRPCQQWCSDFVNWAWLQAGFDVGGITGYSGTFVAYGQRHGTYKPGMYADAQPGDAVLWGTGSSDSRHVGMVTAATADTVTVIHGNYEGAVKEVTHQRTSDIATGAQIYGFVSPR